MPLDTDELQCLVGAALSMKAWLFWKASRIGPCTRWEITSCFFLSLSLFCQPGDVTSDCKSPDYDAWLMEGKGGFNTQNEHLMGNREKMRGNIGHWVSKPTSTVTVSFIIQARTLLRVTKVALNNFTGPIIKNWGWPRRSWMYDNLPYPIFHPESQAEITCKIHSAWSAFLSKTRKAMR